jgi:hypothetical protein
MNNPWYEAVEADGTLTQGDLIVDCPILHWRDEAVVAGENSECEVLRNAFDVVLCDVIVMTQACDLEHKKVRNVLLCPNLSLEDYRANYEETLKNSGNNPTERAWKSHCNDIREGFIWNMSILNPCTEGPVRISHRIVDFHEVFTVPREFLESLLSQRKAPRLRLLPPYREHLSQAFARFFMRVGLPVGVAQGW